MKKVIKFLLLALGFCMFFTGCSRKATNEESSSLSLDAVSPDTKTSDITNESPTPKPNTDPDVLQEIPAYSLQELFDFYRTSDGAFSEGAMAEMIERFVADSYDFLKALSEMDDDIMMRIAKDLGVNMKVLGGSEYEDCLSKVEEFDLDELQEEILNTIKEAFDTTTY